MAYRWNEKTVHSGAHNEITSAKAWSIWFKCGDIAEHQQSKEKKHSRFLSIMPICRLPSCIANIFFDLQRREVRCPSGHSYHSTYPSHAQDKSNEFSVVYPNTSVHARDGNTAADWWVSGEERLMYDVSGLDIIIVSCLLTWLKIVSSPSMSMSQVVCD